MSLRDFFQCSDVIRKSHKDYQKRGIRVEEDYFAFSLLIIKSNF